jgi:hypothetical protein
MNGQVSHGNENKLKLNHGNKNNPRLKVFKET